MSCLFVEQLTVIDCAYLDAARGLVGESWIVDVELDGELDAQSMVLDFGEVKRSLKRALDDSIDHTLLVPGRAPQLTIEQSAAGVDLSFRSDLGTYEHRSPAVAVTLLDSATVDATALIAWLQPRLRACVPANVAAVHLSLRNETIDGAYYHYVHGLKKHAGQCQRIAHGHRSRIEVRIDGVRDTALEQQLATAWRDIYLGSREDILTRGNGRVRYGYNAPEGRFELGIPETRGDLLETDSTVELIAEHLARRCAQLRPGRRVDVRAYEGVMKGATARINP